MRTEKILAAGILAICKKTGRILMGRRSFNSDFPNHWCVFGGTFEESDGIPKNTAKREFKEETLFDGHYTISESPLDVRENNFVTFYTYVGLFDEEFVPIIHSDENVDYGWFELDALPDPNTIIDGLNDTITSKYDTIKSIINANKLKNSVLNKLKNGK